MTDRKSMRMVSKDFIDVRREEVSSERWLERIDDCIENKDAKDIDVCLPANAVIFLFCKLKEEPDHKIEKKVLAYIIEKIYACRGSLPRNEYGVSVLEVVIFYHYKYCSAAPMYLSESIDKLLYDIDGVKNIPAALLLNILRKIPRNSLSTVLSSIVSVRADIVVSEENIFGQMLLLALKNGQIALAVNILESHNAKVINFRDETDSFALHIVMAKILDVARSSVKEDRSKREQYELMMSILIKYGADLLFATEACKNGLDLMAECQYTFLDVLIKCVNNIDFNLLTSSGESLWCCLSSAVKKQLYELLSSEQKSSYLDFDMKFICVEVLPLLGKEDLPSLQGLHKKVKQVMAMLTPPERLSAVDGVSCVLDSVSTPRITSVVPRAQAVLFAAREEAKKADEKLQHKKKKQDKGTGGGERVKSILVSVARDSMRRDDIASLGVSRAIDGQRASLVVAKLRRSHGSGHK